VRRDVALNSFSVMSGIASEDEKEGAGGSCTTDNAMGITLSWARWWDPEG